MLDNMDRVYADQYGQPWVINSHGEIYSQIDLDWIRQDNVSNLNPSTDVTGCFSQYPDSVFDGYPACPDHLRFGNAIDIGISTNVQNHIWSLSTYGEPIRI